MIIKDILKVIYSPVKAFESIAKKPAVKGPFIILVLILACVAIEQYAFASKILLSDRTPTNDQWTEPNISPSWNWTSNGTNRTVSFDNVTVLIGNYSVRSAVLNGTNIWMNITNIGTLNCVADDGYKRLSFCINWTRQPKSLPDNATLRLFSTNENQYFELDLHSLISSENWFINWTTPILGIDVGPLAQDWTPSANSPHWENITGVGFMLKWSDRGNMTMNIDDLYFLKKPYSFLTNESLGNYILIYLISEVIVFFFTWLIYAGSFYVISAMFRQKIGSLRNLFVTVGYAFAVAIVGILVRAILYSILPMMSVPISSWPPANNYDLIRESVPEAHFWSSNANILYSLGFARLGLDIWIIALCAVSARALGGFSWKKVVMFAAFAYLIRFLLFEFNLMM